jgi:adenosylcobinamide hydrolase
MEPALVIDFGGVRRCLSSSVVGGGLRDAHAWLNLQVPHGYSRMDPDAHLREVMRARGLEAGETLGAMTAAHVDRAQRSGEPGVVEVIATVGIGVPLAAAGRLLREVPRVGTINMLVLVDTPLTDAALVYAIQTATEAKAQALADAQIPAANHDGPATGTATDSICIATLPGSLEPFAGPMSPIGSLIALHVHSAIHAGALDFARRAARPRHGRPSTAEAGDGGRA